MSAVIPLIIPAAGAVAAMARMLHELPQLPAGKVSRWMVTPVLGAIWGTVAFMVLTALLLSAGANPVTSGPHLAVGILAAFGGGWACVPLSLRRAAVTAPAMPSVSPVLLFEPRDPRTDLDAADRLDPLLLETCPLCGLHDPAGLALENATWRGWPAHWACTQTVMRARA